MVGQFNDPTLLPTVRESGTRVSCKKCFVCANRVTKVCGPTSRQLVVVLGQS